MGENDQWLAPGPGFRNTYAKVVAVDHPGSNRHHAADAGESGQSEMQAHSGFTDWLAVPCSCE